MKYHKNSLLLLPEWDLEKSQAVSAEAFARSPLGEKMDDKIKIADVIKDFRLKIKDFSDVLNWYVFSDYNNLNIHIEEMVFNLINLVNNKLSYVFMSEYSDAYEAILEIKPVLNEMYKEIAKLKGLYLEIDKYEKFYGKLGLYKILIDKILDDIEKFFIELENLILRGEGKLELTFNIKDEIEAIKNSFIKEEKEDKNLFKSLLWGIGLGWLIFSD